VTAPRAAPRRLRPELVTLTAAKVVSNAALRWVGPFLPTLQRAFGTTTGTLTGIMGASELGGLTTLLTGSMLDRGHERTMFVLGLLAVSASSAIALGGSVETFALSFALLVIGVGNLTVAGHAWIGHRVPYARRGRAIGLFETSWAVSLLVGAPVLALLIRWVGWRGPYVALTIGGALAALVVLRLVEPGLAVARDPDVRHERLPAGAWPAMIASASIAATGLGVFIVSGTWLDERHGVSTAGLGLIAASFGGVELVSSTTVAVAADRLGVRRSVAGGLLLVLTGATTMAVSGDSTSLAIGGLALFLAGFEYAFVSSLTIVTEAAPNARGRAIGISNALGTVARAGAVAGSGQLYERFGIGGSLTMASTTACLALAITVGARHRAR
jgi:predicted MFS family arabinose efflux permease